MAGLSDISGGRSNYGMSSGSRSMFDDLAARAMQTQELPVMPQMGYNMPSMPMIQPTPFAQYAWRTMPDPFGGLGVQPLTGYPSQYPHVLTGTPDSFFRWLPVLQAMMPPMQPLQWPQQKQATQKAAVPARQRATNTGGNSLPLPPPNLQVDPNINTNFAYDPAEFFEMPDYELQDYQPVVPVRDVTGTQIGVRPEGNALWDFLMQRSPSSNPWGM